MIDRLLTYGRMIKFSHSIFALPFALSGVVLASVEAEIRPETVGWVIVAMVGARSAAMGFNRWADRKMDAENPRTSNRELPTGQISSAAVLLFIAVSSGVLVYASYRLNPLCFALSPVALGIVFFYSLTKRFTWATQAFLGLALSVAPIGAWIAVTGSLALEILSLGGAVLLWVAGFDIIYATQDVDFDRQFGACSIPQRFGIAKALWIAQGLHVCAFVAMLVVGQVFSLGWLYHLGVFGIGGLLVYEHRLVKPDDLSKAGIAFLNLNAMISVAYFAVTAIDVLVL
ncbi:MAG: 4-hydroxybenzoate octaprenyltransferase [Gemmatimonadetes bacterium]|nr:4-hydroxybenzoate octaprenyltransferase [Gemmatimonadota bacterium]|tara:strand:- start:478 stop:1335 length:858 start_codon:yes stop_codon:yes gene_type:complete